MQGSRQRLLQLMSHGQDCINDLREQSDLFSGETKSRRNFHIFKGVHLVTVPLRINLVLLLDQVEDGNFVRKSQLNKPLAPLEEPITLVPVALHIVPL